MIIKKYFPEINERQSKQFDMLEGLYSEWNNRINVISRKDTEWLYERHVLHSLVIAKIITFADNTKVIDVGTGGGFPGIPLAIMFPNTTFHLVDSIGKKLKVVNDIVQSLQLNNVVTQHTRAEMVTGKYDFAVSRAVAPLSTIVSWLDGKILKENRNILPNGMIFLKGGDLTVELSSLVGAGFTPPLHTTLFNISDFFNEPFFEEKKVILLYKLAVSRFP